MATNLAKANVEVAKLVNKLQRLADKSDSEGRKIRRQLRSLGHKGGTGKGPGRPAKKAVKKPAPKKAKVVRKAKDPITAALPITTTPRPPLGQE